MINGIVLCLLGFFIVKWGARIKVRSDRKSHLVGLTVLVSSILVLIGSFLFSLEIFSFFGVIGEFVAYVFFVLPLLALANYYESERETQKLLYELEEERRLKRGGIL